MTANLHKGSIGEDILWKPVSETVCNAKEQHKAPSAAH